MSYQLSTFKTGKLEFSGYVTVWLTSFSSNVVHMLSTLLYRISVIFIEVFGKLTNAFNKNNVSTYVCVYVHMYIWCRYISVSVCVSIYVSQHSIKCIEHKYWYIIMYMLHTYIDDDVTSNLHSLLQPFLLRRVKSEVSTGYWFLLCGQAIWHPKEKWKKWSGHASLYYKYAC